MHTTRKYSKKNSIRHNALVDWFGDGSSLSRSLCWISNDCCCAAKWPSFFPRQVSTRLSVFCLRGNFGESEKLFFDNWSFENFQESWCYPCHVQSSKSQSNRIVLLIIIFPSPPDGMCRDYFHTIYSYPFQIFIN